MTKKLNSKEGRKKIISDNMSDMLNTINDSYGPIILEELMKRIEYTISEFNEEMESAFELLKQREERRIKAYEKYSEENQYDSESQNEWEKKIEETNNK